MNHEHIKELIELVSETEVHELELESEGLKLRIRKESAPAPMIAAPAVVPAAAPQAAIAPGASAAPATAPSPNESSEDDSEEGLTLVTSPMVGTFYRQPEPGADPFVKEGDSVSRGQVLCIIEAMKLMNEIEAEHHGEVVKVFVDNGQPVQYGDKLFAIRES